MGQTILEYSGGQEYKMHQDTSNRSSYIGEYEVNVRRQNSTIQEKVPIGNCF